MKLVIWRALACVLAHGVVYSAGAAPITRIWLTHKTNEPTALVVNWETDKPGPSQVDYGASDSLGGSATEDETVTLHHVEVPFPQTGLLHYRVRSGEEQSAIHAVKSYSGESLRIAAAANWQALPPLDALLKDDPHLLLSCGDMVMDVAPLKTSGPEGNTKPFTILVERYAALFARVPFLPALGNHDRQIRYALKGAATEPMYDLEAIAFRNFFPLPENGRNYAFFIPAFGLRLVALDASHISDLGTLSQSCPDIGRTSEQFRWYRNLIQTRTQPFMITYYNESSANMRSAERGAWETLLRQNSVALSGFGSYVERSEVKGTPYFNSGLKVLDAFRDGAGGKFYQATAGYTLISIPKEGELLTVELKGLDGAVLDQSTWPGRAKPGNRQRSGPE